MIDFAWVLFVGASCGFQRQDVGKLTFDEWQSLSTQYKRAHNMRVKNQYYLGV